MNATPQSGVNIDGTPYGHTPLKRLVLPAGAHRFRFHSDGFRTGTATITIRPGAVDTLRGIRLQRDSNP